MKANKLLRFGLGLVALVIICLSFVWAVPGVIMGEALVGTITSKDVDTASPELNIDSVLEGITEISPARAPMDTLMRRVGRSMKAKDWKVDNYDVVERPFQDTTSALYTTVASAKSAEIPV